MTAIHWLNAINGGFTNPSDWSGGNVPGASDDAILDAVGSAFTVTSSMNEEVRSVQLASNATLLVTAGAFTASEGTGSGSNAGIILVGAGATLVAGGTIDNSGTIALYDAKHSASALQFDAVSTLTGGGQIELGGKVSIATEKTAFYVTNLDNTITGVGTFGNKRGEFTNGLRGVVDANGAKPLTINAGIVFQNDGLIEATGEGGLTLEGRQFGNFPTGVVLAGDGSVVRIADSLMGGGTLKSNGSGLILANNLTFGDLTNDAVMRVSGESACYDQIVNNGTVAVYNGGIILNSLKIEGTGVFDLEGGVIAAGSLTPGDKLTLASGSISGYGRLGDPSTSLQINIGSSGVVIGTGSLVISANLASVSNAGLIVAAAGGSVVVDDSIVNSGTLSAQGGTLEAESAVGGSGVAMINEGTLEFLSKFNEAVTFNGAGALELAKSQTFKNSVTGFSTDGASILDLGDIGFVNAEEATFSGSSNGGVLTVTDGAHTANIVLKGDYLGDTFIASSDGHGGTNVVAQSPGNARAPVDSFIAAMAGLGSPAGESHLPILTGSTREVLLTTPRVAIA